MSDDDQDRSNFEQVAKALAEEVTRAIERFSEIDVDEIARTASAEAERARLWIDDIGRWPPGPGGRGGEGRGWGIADTGGWRRERAGVAASAGSATAPGDAAPAPAAPG